GSGGVRAQGGDHGASRQDPYRLEGERPEYLRLPGHRWGWTLRVDRGPPPAPPRARSHRRQACGVARMVAPGFVSRPHRLAHHPGDATVERIESVMFILSLIPLPLGYLLVNLLPGEREGP